MADWERPLTDAEKAKIERARTLAFRLYDGKEVPHRSCGIAMAETFGVVLLPDFSSVMIYLVMALVLLLRPQGLLPVKSAH